MTSDTIHLASYHGTGSTGEVKKISDLTHPVTGKHVLIVEDIVNNWRMAELHAKEAPDRVRELESWGAVFDRTKDGRINQRNFGGHRYPRLAHVGDRTGLELIRTLQDHGIHQGIEVYMEVTVLSLLKDGDRVIGCLAYEREH